MLIKRLASVTGYTLIELLCCLLIIALLGGLALPGLHHAQQRARRSEAQLALLRIQAQQERQYAQRQHYSDVLASDETGDGLGVGERSANGNYALSVQLLEQGQHYRATARVTADGAQSDDTQCAELWLDDSDRRGASSANCWP